MRILFARHGESEANILHVISNRDLPHKLTETGISQSFALANALASFKLVKIISSPIIRAQETAGIVAQRYSLPLTISPALCEFDCGRMEGRGDEQAWAAHREVTRAWDEDRDYGRRIPPDGDSYLDLKNRFLPFIAGLAADNQDLSGDILLVSHGAVLYQMLPLVLANVDRAFTQSHPIGYCGLIVTHPTGALRQSPNTKYVCSRWGETKLA